MKKPSNFIYAIIWTSIILIFFYISFFIIKVPEHKYTFEIPLYIILMRFFSSAFFVSYVIIYSNILRDMISLKYKIIKKDNMLHGDYKVRYLTIFCLFIPYWKRIDYNYVSCDYENLFGGTVTHGYREEIYYKTEEDAIVAINKHKNKLNNNLITFFKFKEKTIKEVKYYK